MGTNQSGFFPMRGSLGEANFYKDAAGNFKVRRRSEINKKRMASDPAFERTREHMAEFSAVMKAGKLLRNALASIIHLASDRTARNRLTSLLMKIAKTDPVNVRGMRNIMDGDAAQLRGFEFSAAGVINTIFKGLYQGSIDRDAGKAVLGIEAFTPGISVVHPPEVTHFQFHTAVLEINFRSGFRLFENKSSEKMAIDQQPVKPLKLETGFTPASGNLVLLLFGIDFHQYTNGIYYPIKTKDINGLQITEVSQVSEFA